jgi:hypothetical protein
MSVKKLLAKQKAGFISLHEVLTRMTRIDGASYEEAATLLHQLLFTDDPDRPAWFVCDKLHGKHMASDRQENVAWNCLRKAVRDGTPLRWWDDDENLPF